jgi:hypothetical protein
LDGKGSPMMVREAILLFISLNAFLILPVTSAWAQSLRIRPQADQYPFEQMGRPLEVTGLAAGAYPSGDLDRFFNGGAARNTSSATAVVVSEAGSMETSTGMRSMRPWYKKWWVWTIVGAVVTGVVIAAGGSGSGGGGGDGNDGGNGETPTTGSIDISGPIP